MNKEESTFLVNTKYEFFKLKELKTLEDVLKVLNALEMSFISDKVKEYNLYDVIEVKNQNK
jgi:hypothetical protein